MNGMGVVETGIITSIHFSRHYDGPLATVKSLFRNICYGPRSNDDNTLRSKCRINVGLDRGYHIESVISLLIELVDGYFGTHSEKIGQWPFSSSAAEKTSDQKLVPTDGAQFAAWATRKVKGVKTYALSYRNGTQGIGNLHFSDPNLYRTWDMDRNGSLGSHPTDIMKWQFPEDSVEGHLFHQWRSYIFELTSVQAVIPWFQFRPGFLTGTTSKNVCTAIKFKMLDDPTI